MKYIVTFATTDDLTSNPFWHSFLLLSVVDETGKINVVDNWGYYGIPSTSRTSFITKLKIKIGLDIDLTGNHGMLRHEEARFLDLGKGLHGKSFELTETQFNTLQQRCLTQVKLQNEAIQDYTKGIKGKPPEKTRIYPQEEYSKSIYALEKARAHEAGEEPRLKPFEIRTGWSFWGPTLKESFTCKSMALELLSGILKPEYIDDLTEHGKHPTVPKYSGKQENIYLYSSGPLRAHKKRSGDVVYYRSLEDEGVTLSWVIPPQEIITLTNETKSLLTIPPNYIDDVKILTSKLQQLEWVFINAKLDQDCEPYRQGLIKRIRDYYLSFSRDNKGNYSHNKIGNNAFFMNLGNLPNDPNNNPTSRNICRVQNFINLLHLILVDGCRIYNPIANETQIEKEIRLNSKRYELELLGNYLSLADKHLLAEIIGKAYFKPAFIIDEESLVTQENESMPLAVL
jgi:hypothetical protein